MQLSPTRHLPLCGVIDMTETMTVDEYRKEMGLTPLNLATLDATLETASVRPEADEVVIVIVGEPAYTLSPNARVFWAVKAKDSLIARMLGWDACRDKARVSGPVQIEWRIFLDKGKRKLDRDNMHPCLKPFQDSFVTAGVLQNDSPDIVGDSTIDQVIWSNHKSTPRIVAFIRRAS